MPVPAVTSANAAAVRLPDRYAGGAGFEVGQRSGGEQLIVRFGTAEQVDVHDGRGAVALFEVGVGDAYPLQVRAGDHAGAGRRETVRQFHLKVDLVAVGDHPRPAGVQDKCIRLAVEASGAGRVDVAPQVHRLFDVQEALVVAGRLLGDAGLVLAEAGRVAVVARGAADGLHRRVGPVRRAAEEDVADVPVVTAEDHRVAGDLGAVRAVVGGGAVHHRPGAHRAGDQVVDVRAALAVHLDRGGRGEHIVLHQVRPVADLDEQVALVGVQNILREPGPLGLPVEPDAQRGVVDPVVPDEHVDRGVQFDATDLVAVELALHRDVPDVVVLDGGENAAEVPDDAVLPAVVDPVATDDV